MPRFGFIDPGGVIATPDDMVMLGLGYRFGAGDVFGAAAGLQFTTGTSAAVARNLSLGTPSAGYSATGEPNPLYDQQKEIDRPIGVAPPVRPENRGMPEEEFNAKGYGRGGAIKFNPWITEEEARFNAERFDAETVRRHILANRKPGFWTGAAMIAGGLVGSIPDPLNLVGLGELSALKAATRTGEIMLGAGRAAAENAALAAAMQPFYSAQSRMIGLDYGWDDAMLDIVYAGGIGGVLGGVHGALRFRAPETVATAPEPGLVAGAVAPEPIRAEAAAPDMTEIVSVRGAQPVDTRYEVVEASSLVTPFRADRTPEPAYPAELRATRVGAEEGLGPAATPTPAAVEPGLLARSTAPEGGPPVVGPDNVVEAGAQPAQDLRRMYAEAPTVAADYRAALERQGFKTEGMTAPVLVRRRVSEATPELRAAMARQGEEAFASAATPVTVAPGTTAAQVTPKAPATRQGIPVAPPLPTSERQARAQLNAVNGAARELTMGPPINTRGKAPLVPEAKAPDPVGDAIKVAKAPKETAEGAAPVERGISAASEPDPDVADAKAMERAGRLAPEDAAEMKAAERQMEDVADIELAYQQAAACVVSVVT